MPGLMRSAGADPVATIRARRAGDASVKARCGSRNIEEDPQ
jgi:hypothetical protein